jgi:nucleoside diphosphate kinase
MLKPDKDFLYHHYETIGKMISRRGQKPFDLTIDWIAKLPVIAIVLEGVEVIEYVRKLVGSTEPKTAAP